MGFTTTQLTPTKLQDATKDYLQTMKAYRMREDFNRFWAYTSPGWASKFLREWCTRASRSRIEPMQKIAKMLRKHEQLLLNWFESQGLSSGVVEGVQHQSEIDREKSVWIQGLRNHHYRTISSAWQPSGAKTNPQILRMRPFLNVVGFGVLSVVAELYVLLLVYPSLSLDRVGMELQNSFSPVSHLAAAAQCGQCSSERLGLFYRQLIVLASSR
jgi:hypothetical protein